MDFESISPFVRFAAGQHLVGSQDYSAYGNVLVGFDHRIYFCVSGVGTVTVENANYALAKGDLLMWRAGTPYSYRSVSQDFSCLTCNFDYVSQRKKCSLPKPPVSLSLFSPDDLLEPAPHFDPPDFPFNGTVYLKSALYLHSQFKSLILEFTNGFKYRDLSCTCLLTDILLEILRHLEFSDGSGRQYLLTVDVTKYIREHYAEPLSNESIGKTFGYHPNYINHLMQKFTGTSLRQYIITIRLNQAIQMIMDTTLSIDEISEAVGLSGRNYLTRLLKSRYGVSPASLRS